MSPQEKLLKESVNQILEHPETWDQSCWHGSCGTTHCVAGWVQVKSGKPANDSTARADAKEALALSEGEANWLFAAERSLYDIYCFARGFNRAGFNRDGYDRAGFNRDGYDRAGFNRAGFNRAGFNRAGYDRDGYDCDGFNRDGYDCDGYDCDGYDRAGYDQKGVKLAPFDLSEV